MTEGGGDSDGIRVGNHGFVDFSIAISVSLAVPAALCLLFSAPWTAVLWGGAAWAAALVPKLAVSLLVPRARTAGQAVLLGMASAVSELGCAAVALYLMGPPSSLPAVLAFGAGAAAIEVGFILVEAITQKPEPSVVEAWRKGARASFFVRHTLAVERLGAMTRHIGSRGLVAAALAGGTVWPAALAVAAFAAMDGVADYGEARGVDWFRPGIHRLYFSSIWLVGFVEIALTVLLFLDP
jgi:hypothetical protein